MDSMHGDQLIKRSDEPFPLSKPKPLSDFKIGTEFEFLETKLKCRVTDVGTRTVTFIRLDQEDERNYNGPPYSVAEYVLDEYDLESITILSQPEEAVPAA